jgi:hypothetical protein
VKTLSFPQLLFASLGALLIYAAIKGQNPAQIIRDTLSKQPAAGAANKGDVNVPTTLKNGAATTLGGPTAYTQPPDMSNPVSKYRKNY